MIKVSDLYKKTQITFNNFFVDLLVDQYLDIPFNKLTSKDNIIDVLNNQFNEFDTSTNSKINFNSFKKLIKKECDNPLFYEVDGNFINIKSWNINGENEEYLESEADHRFYIGVVNKYQYQLAFQLYKQLTNANIPFYFKLNTSDSDRYDNIILYVLDEYLSKTMEALELLKINQLSALSCGKGTSSIYGKYDLSIGYSNALSNDNYSRRISEIFISSVEEALRKYKVYIKLDVVNICDGIINNIKGIKSEEAKDRLRVRTYFNYLYKNDITFKNHFIEIFKNNLLVFGINLDNICFSEKMRKKTLGLSFDGDELNYPYDVFVQIFADEIPDDKFVLLKSGFVYNKAKFLKMAYSIRPKYNSYQEIFSELIDSFITQEELNIRNQNTVRNIGELNERRQALTKRIRKLSSSETDSLIEKNRIDAKAIREAQRKQEEIRAHEEYLEEQRRLEEERRMWSYNTLFGKK